MKQPVLSKRLQHVADMVTPGMRVCDVGCDHGFISIYLIRQKIAKKVIAMDVNRGPLERAREHIEKLIGIDMTGDRKYIDLRLSDGIEKLQIGEADTVIMAGMGGRLMMRILSADREKTASLRELILQPQSELPEFRRFLRENGYVIRQEDMVLEEGKFYPMMKAVPKESQLPRNLCGEAVWPVEITDRYGPKLLADQHPVLRQYLLRELENNAAIREALLYGQDNERKSGKIAELQQKAMEIQHIFAIWAESGQMLHQAVNRNKNPVKPDS